MKKTDLILLAERKVKIGLPILLWQASRTIRFLPYSQITFSDERFEGLSTNAKLLYGMMIDRMELSQKNGWLDREGRVIRLMK